MKRILSAFVLILACTLACAQKHSSFNFMIDEVDDQMRCFEFEPLDNSQISRLFYEVMGKTSHLYDVNVKGILLDEDGSITYALDVPLGAGGIDMVSFNSKMNLRVRDRRVWTNVVSFSCTVKSAGGTEVFILPEDYGKFAAKIGEKQMPVIQDKASNMIDCAFEEMYRCWWNNYYTTGVGISR